MQGAAAIPGDVRGLLADVDTFISQTLKGENLSKKAKEKKDVLLKKIKEVKASYPQEFQDKELEDEEESEGSFSSPPDSVSIASDRYDKDDEGHSDVTGSLLGQQTLPEERMKGHCRSGADIHYPRSSLNSIIVSQHN